MKRAYVLGILLVIGTVAAAAYQPPAQPAGPKIIQVEKLKDNLYVFRGDGGGGNVAVYVGATGVTVVDAKNPGWGQPILERSRS